MQASFLSTPSSPKAKSAPSTPCNVTPIAFHQHNPYVNSILNPSPANTLPPDIGKNMVATCRASPASMVMMAERTFGVRAGGGCGSSGAGGSSVQSHEVDQPTGATASNSSELIYNNDIVSDEPPCQEAEQENYSVQYLDELARKARSALRLKDYAGAVKLFTNCIQIAETNQNIDYLKENYKIYSDRAEAHFKLANYQEAIADSRTTRNLNPKWTQSYYLQGQAQFLSGEYADALAVFSFGLTYDSNNKQLFESLVKAALESKIVEGFESKYNIIKEHGYDKKPFIIMAVLGQELLTKGHTHSATIIIESAFKLEQQQQQQQQQTACQETSGLDDANLKKFKGSILSTIAFAYCSMKDYEKALVYMEKELKVESELEDIERRCRVLSNLGYTYFKIREFNKSLEAHRKQLDLALQNHLYQQASAALNAIGHVHSARNDFLSAQTSHTRCLDVLKLLNNNYDFNQHQELLSIGHTYAMLGDYGLAEEKYNEAFREIRHSKMMKEEYQVGMCMLHFNLAYLALKKQNLLEAQRNYQSVIDLARDMAANLATTSTSSNDLICGTGMGLNGLVGAGTGSGADRGDTMVTNNSDNSANSYSNSVASASGIALKRKAALIEMRAVAGMGHSFRMFRSFPQAREWFQKQLHLARSLKDKTGQSQALSNLGMTYQQNPDDFEEARKLFEENLCLVENDPILKAYAHSYMGNIYYLMHDYNSASVHYENSLKLFKDSNYCSSEKKTISLNLAFVREKMAHRDLTNSPSQQLSLKRLMISS